jgi:hypothetical protein
MKKYFIFCMLLIVLNACDNHSSVNIIVTNTQPRSIYLVNVSVSIKEVCKLLNNPNFKDEIAKPLVLNEKNEAIPYTFNAKGDTIRFVMPLIHKKSQKTFSISTEKPTLSNSFLRIRKNIQIKR